MTSSVAQCEIPQRPALVLFDLDGTLVDSVPDLAYSLEHMLQELELPTCREEQVRLWVGNGAARLVGRALTGRMDGEPDEALFKRALPLFMDLYGRHACDRSRLYPGVREGLEVLKNSGARMACVTNKPACFIEPLFNKLDIAHYFELSIGGDSLPRIKPDPLPFVHAREHFGIAASETLVVGDSANDILAARAAGLAVVCLSYGYNHGNDIRDSEPDAVIDSLTELSGLLAIAA